METKTIKPAKFVSDPTMDILVSETFIIDAKGQIKDKNIIIPKDLLIAHDSILYKCISYLMLQHQYKLTKV